MGRYLGPTSLLKCQTPDCPFQDFFFIKFVDYTQNVQGLLLPLQSGITPGGAGDDGN